MKLNYRVNDFLAIAFVIFCSLTVSQTVNAVDLQSQKEALDMIADFAGRICESVPLEGSTEHLELTGEAKAELNRLLKKIATLGIDGAVKYQEEEWSGVLQKDISKIIESRTNCKLRIWNDLKFKINLNEDEDSGTIKDVFGDPKNFVINGDFSKHWRKGWEKKLKDPTHGSLYVELVNSSNQAESKILHVKMEGQNSGWVEQTIELPKKQGIKNLYFNVETKIITIRGGGFNLGAPIEAYIAVQFLGKNSKVLGTISLANSKKNQFEGTGLVGVVPGNKSSANRCFIPIGNGYKTINFSVEDKFYDCLSGIHKPNEIKKVVIAAVLEVKGRNDSAEIFMDNVKLFYK